jgi:hypothetical protein
MSVMQGSSTGSMNAVLEFGDLLVLPGQDTVQSPQRPPAFSDTGVKAAAISKRSKQSVSFEKAGPE